ncbi:MAG: hypothetical protein ACKPGT_13445 [Microcystis sp.]
MAKRRSEWTEDELDEMLASAGRGVEAISRSERFAIDFFMASNLSSSLASKLFSIKILSLASKLLSKLTSKLASN